MNITKVQKKILEDLYRRDIKGEEVRIIPEHYELIETDEITKVRELVFNIEALLKMKLIEVEDKYYYESDIVSFEYMNKAIEIREERLKISAMGIEYLEMCHLKLLEKGYTLSKRWLNKQFFDQPYKYLVSHVITFLLGAAVMWGIMKLI